MTYVRTWTAERVRAVMTTESRQKARALFLSTHRPFQRIRVDFCKERATAGFIGEEELHGLIHAGQLHDDNRLFFVVGEAGCGKSELCQWLEYTADAETRIAVHIPRSMTSALGVASLLRARLGMVAPSALHATPVGTQAQLIALSALTQWYEAGVPALPAAQPWERILIAPALTQAVAAYLERAAQTPAPVGRIVDVATLAAVCTDYGLCLDDGALEAKVTAVHELLTSAMERLLWTGDVRALLRSLSEQAVASGRRPLLLIEDITAFQTLGDILLDYLLDLTSGHMDAVIGVTTGFERSQLPRATLSGDLTHVHHRLRARLVLTDEHGRAYGLEEDLIEFARAYLRAAKEGDTDTVARRTPPGFDPDLYPFTATALRRAFAHLEEDGNARQTPRLFIEQVLAAVLLALDPPPAALDASRYLRRPPTYVRRGAMPDAALSALMRWYADVEEEIITVDVRIPAAWGITAPATPVCNGLLTFPRAYVARAADTPAPAPERDRELAELQAWLDHGGRYPSRETLKRAIEHVVRDIGDPRALGSPDAIAQNRAELYYARGEERLPIILADDSGDVEYPGGAIAIHVTRAPEERAILEELALREMTGATLVDVCQNVTLTMEWAKERFETYQRNLRAEFARRLGGLDPNELIVLAWRLVAALGGAPWDDAPRLAPLPSLPSVAPMGASDETVGPWARTAHPSCFAAGKSLIARHEEVRRLFIGAFTLHETFLDMERFRAVSSRMDPAQTLQRIAALPTNTLGGLPFKIRPSTLALPQLLVELQRYAKALLRVDAPAALASDLEEVARRIDHLRAQQMLDLAGLRERLQELRERCSALVVTWQAAWDAVSRVLTELQPDTLNALMESAERQQAQGMTLLTDGRCDLWAYQAWRLSAAPVFSHPYWAACETLAAIQQEALQVARRRAPRTRKALAGTREYQKLLATMRAYVQEVRRDANLAE
jgi:hypothetical protein